MIEWDIGPAAEDWSLPASGRRVIIWYRMLGDQRFFERKITAPRALQFTSMGQEAIPISSNEMRKIHRGGEGSSSQSAAGRKVNVSQSRREQPVREPGKPGKAPKEPKEKAKHPILRFIGRTIATLLCLGIMAGSLLAVGMVYYVVQATANDGDLLDLDNIQLSQSSVVMANDPDTGAQVEYATLRSSNSHRVWADLEQIPTNLQYAFICTEDKDFYNEPGVNFKRTIGAMVNEYLLPIYSSKQGASTLEQQLIKNLTDDNSASGIEGALRKLREIYRALCLSRSYSKETILEAYLNTISFTGTIQGVQTAANEYFNKDVSELTLWECATIASITKNPTNYNPYTNPENLINRRNFIMYNMWQQGVISEEDYRNAAAQPLTLAEDDSDKKNTSVTSYFTDALYYELLNDLQEKANYTAEEASSLIFNGGLRVYSTVDPKVQSVIEKELYNADDEIPALWHEAPVALRDYPADTSSWDDVQYDEATGLPVTKDGYAVYGVEDIPVYDDDAETELKKGTSTDPNYPNDDTVYLCVYEKVRTEASAAILDYAGNILGIGGGIGEKQYDLGTNRATVPHQTGSTMKPIGAYCLALDYGLINYSSQILDAPFYAAADKEVLKEQYSYMDKYSAAAQSRSDIWRDWPTNYGGVGGQGNPMLVYDALQQSYNTVAVWVGDMVGVDYLYNFVHDTLECSYISAENDMDLGPLVLGSQSNGLTVVQLAGAYTMFNTGTFTTPHYYTEITDYQGNMILDNNKYINTTQAISADTAYIMNRMMWNVLHSRKGTAYGKAPDGEMDSVAKTGTTSNYKDYTFAGLTPYYVTAIWWGCDRPTEMDTLGKAGKNASPIQYAWKALMEDLQADLPVKEFAKGENVVEKHFDTSTGAIISSGGSVGYYTEDNLPDNSYTVSEDDPYAALAQAAADAAAGAE